jgi:hypothetical protein
MSKSQLLFIALVAATTFAVPATARDNYPVSSRISRAAYAGPGPYAGYYAPAGYAYVPYAGYAIGRGCLSAPRVGAFATEPWTDSVPCQPGTRF